MSRKQNGNLAESFGAPPFSVLDARRRGWIERRRRLLEAMGEHGETRDEALFRCRGNDPVTRMIQKGRRVSVLDPVVAELACAWFGRPGWAAFDPFAGDLVFGYTAARMGLSFLGLEIRAAQAEANQRRVAAAGLSARYVAMDAAEMDAAVGDETADLLFSCPPYWNLERYDGPPGDLSAMRLPAFRAHYSAILTKAAGKLKPNRFAVLIVGEARRESGELIGLVPHTIETMTGAGLSYWNEILLLQTAGTAPLRAGRPFNLTRKICRVHQTMLVFAKGDPRKAVDELGPVSPPQGLRHDLYT